MAAFIMENSISPRWRHQRKAFSVLLALCAGNSPVTGEFPAQRPVTRSFDVFFDLLPNKRLSEQSRGWWFETPSCSVWRHCNAKDGFYIKTGPCPQWRGRSRIVAMVTKRKHFPRHWSFVRGINRSPVNFPNKGQWRGALMFPFSICVWINGRVNNSDDGDLRRRHAYHDVTVMTHMYHVR